MHKKLVFQVDGNVKTIIHASRGAGAWVSFPRDAAGNYVPDADVNDRLYSISGGWLYVDAASRVFESYDDQGNLKLASFASGARLSYTYSDASTAASVAPLPGLLIKVQDQFGRSVQFVYEQPAGLYNPRVNRIVDPAGQSIGALYDAAGNLSQWAWPDGQSRTYKYESGLPWALTGIVDENAVRYAAFVYDAFGRVVSTEHAGGVNHYAVSYGVPPQWSIVEVFDPVAFILWRHHYWQLPQGTQLTQPNGEIETLTAGLILGMPRVTSRSQPAGAGVAASTSYTAYNDNGSVASIDDFNGTRTCYAYDSSTNLETVRVEGLSNGQVCADVVAANAALPIGARKASSKWHPAWRLKVKEVEPGKLSNYVYNGQPDPTAGNVRANCVATSPLLPDGQPVAALCKRTEQGTTDSSGSTGFRLAGSPATAGDSSYSGVTMLLHMDDIDGPMSFSDTSLQANSMTVHGSVFINNSTAKYGTGSASFDGGTGNYLSTVSSVLALGANDFTIEGWVRLNAYGSNATIISNYGSGGSRGAEILTQGDGKISFRYTNNGSSDTGSVTHQTPLALNTWHHFAAVRSGTSLTMYLNGVPSAAATINSTIFSPSTETNIGRTPDVGSGVWYLNGYLDDLRVTVGVARYTSAFNPPAAPFGDATVDTPAVPSLMDASVPNRVWSYTYNQYGQVLTAKGPRTDVNDTTTYAYYADTTADHTLGDLQSVTNPAGHVTQYVRYDKAGRVLRSIDPTGATTDITYKPRGWVESVTVTPAGGGTAQVTTYSYDAVGQLKQVTLPDAVTLQYAYDDAHRLTGITDGAGNTVTYTLDNAGNKTGETLKDAGGNLARNITRVFDAIGRVQQVIGATQ